MQNDLNAPAAIVQREEDRKPLVIFGRDVTKIPCFRNSFLYGISSGIGGGLLAFLFTSRPKFAMHCAMATYFNVTVGYWFYCRYTRDLDRFNAIRMQDIFQNAAVMEGSEEGPEIVIDKELVDV